MSPLALFLNRYDRLRAGWRLLLFVFAFYSVYAGLFPLLGDRFRLLLLLTATLVGWGCGRLFESLPFHALGWTPHRGWLRDLLTGLLVGAASLVAAALLAVIFGGLRLAFTPPAFGVTTLVTFAGASAAWLLPAAAEEALFRGYPLQTTMRAWPFWLAALPSSLLFASVHLTNPHAAWLPFVNTALAGLWLAVAYWRTRSLWLPLALHWSWNWAMGSLLGLPVSGVTRFAASAFFRPTDYGAEWLTGGAYGIEGGAACTAALLLSTLFLWRTRRLSAAPELRHYTEGEIPGTRRQTADEALATGASAKRPPASNA